MEFIHKKILEKLKEENPKLFDSEAEIKIVELESNENLVDVDFNIHVTRQSSFLKNSTDDQQILF